MCDNNNSSIHFNFIQRLIRRRNDEVESIDIKRHKLGVRKGGQGKNYDTQSMYV
jgi:hypothetical protein